MPLIQVIYLAIYAYNNKEKNSTLLQSLQTIFIPCYTSFFISDLDALCWIDISMVQDTKFVKLIKCVNKYSLSNPSISYQMMENGQ